MSADRLSPPPGIAEMLEKAEERGKRIARVEIGDAVGRMDLSGFCYDTRNQGEVLRLRDAISEYIIKGRV